MDFGLARLADRPSVTRTATILGTLPYMSPEQAQGSPGDCRSDLWSLGAVLYEMVTGRLPFAAENEAGVLHGILHREHDAITALRADVPLDLDRIVDKALAKRADNRYQHAEDLLIDLRQVRRQLDSNLSRRSSGAAPRTASLRRERAAWAVLATALLVLCIWLFLSGSPGVTPVTRTLVNVAPAERLRAQPGDDGLPQDRPSRIAIALSPDGRFPVFSAVRGEEQQLYGRPIDALLANPLAGTDGRCVPFSRPMGSGLASGQPAH